MTDYFNGLEDQLAELTAVGAHLDGPARRSVSFRLTSRLVPAVSLVVAIAIAVVVLTSVHHGRGSGPAKPSAQTTSARGGQLAHALAVFRRPQTARDRTLGLLLQHVARLNHSPSLKRALDGSVPSLTRYVETISGGREVFLVIYGPGGLPGGARRSLAGRNGDTDLGLFIVQPSGRPVDGQAVIQESGSANNFVLWVQARTGPAGCALNTHYGVVPDRVARVRWQFAPYGTEYPRPLTVNVQVHGNVAAATIYGRPWCARPQAVTLYNAAGQVISHTGSLPNPKHPRFVPRIVQAQVATPVSVRLMHATHYCFRKHPLPQGRWARPTDTGPYIPCDGPVPTGDVRAGPQPAGAALAVFSWTARQPVTPSFGQYEFFIANPGNCGGGGGSLFGRIRAGERLTRGMFITPRCRGTFTGTVSYTPNPRAAAGIGVGVPSPRAGSLTVGRFSFTLR